ncbi:MAG: phosphomethylpyrimidine synthase ThiC, partial [Planctomycetes bacterium]|nr:phosphomethylpyrimidine synthase ThiC [Planctomycetota bacterium]
MRKEWLSKRDFTDVNTQMYYAKQGIVTEEIEHVAKLEKIDADELRKLVAQGKVAIPANIKHENMVPMGIGHSLSVKINTNIGNSPLSSGLDEEVDKLKHSLKYKTDTVMDLSTGSNIKEIRQAIIDNSPIPVGTVPIYEVFERVESVYDMTPQLLLEVVEEQAEQGVDYMTIHAGLLKSHMPKILARKIPLVSRGGSLLAHWMLHHNKENPFYTHYEDLMKILRKYDVTISIGDGLRPGCLHDSSDDAQFAELAVMGELARKSWEYDVQVMIEGPGHIPLQEIEMNMKKERELCDDAPFYILGPLPTDIAAGYDHISSAIGGAFAAWHGASMLCYVTPKEHLGLPNAEDVRIGVIAHK